MRYMFRIYLDEQVSAARSDAQVKAGMDAHTPYIEMLRRNGKYIGSDALMPSHTARTLRDSGGKPAATHGPFAESREQFGGYYVVDAADLDEAIELATQCPGFKTVVTAIEIRPNTVAAVSAQPGTGASRFLLTLFR